MFDDDDDVFEFFGSSGIWDDHGGDCQIWELSRGLKS
eukprot:CAMPEP_0172431894 /NCGR_PEP_ID=MMETSP1064-20121228/60495_1 /TAXON_ID=202472 /ORGANISM="Aulacoseira subarctica , Strain CCAP 1002/5" /LENGTH=36 /DNA_ID= /DNA_START= /DNA_END= /DNA_ORIENTATION=